MYSIVTTKQFEKDILLAEGQKRNMTVFADILKLLEEGKTIPEKYKNHKLKGIKPTTWDLHIQPDWILLYIKDDKEKVIKLVRIGSHAHIFG
jgi:mRNA interferase YafQ